jgi:IMP dehydrogenase
LEKAYKIMVDKRIEKLPVLDKKGKLAGVYTIKDYKQFHKYPNAATDKRGRLLVGAAIGVHEVDVDRAIMVTKAGADVLFLDIAHGHSVYSKEMIKRLKVKEKIKTPIIVGNVATAEGVKFAYDIGADGVKVGIGPGFVCKTRTVAGTGVPQITAVIETRNEMEKKSRPIPIISDGGIREPGDVGKAIAAGADSVMIGSIFSGTDASPGDLMKVGGILQKRVRGMASKKVLEERKKISDSTTKISVYAEEGRETFTPYQGLTEEILNEIIGGLRSSMSYAGAHTIKELQGAQLVHISSSGANEQKRPLNTN